MQRESHCSRRQGNRHYINSTFRYVHLIWWEEMTCISYKSSLVKLTIPFMICLFFIIISNSYAFSDNINFPWITIFCDFYLLVSIHNIYVNAKRKLTITSIHQIWPNNSFLGETEDPQATSFQCMIPDWTRISYQLCILIKPNSVNS